MSDHSELLSRAQAWAQKKKLPLDVQILDEVLRLRETYDGLPVGEWPAGSVEHLLLERWPGHGSVSPDVETMGPTLDTFWRFLRGNGLMAFSSAPPKRLMMEFTRAAPRMGERYDDPQAQGLNRQLFDFGADLGIDLTEAGSIEEMQAKLDQLMQAWNNLPAEERLRRSPRGSGPSPFGSHPAWEDLGDDDGWDPEDDTLIERSDPSESAPFVHASPYIQRCLALADWVGEGKEVTAKAVLRPAHARAAYVDLELVRYSEIVARDRVKERPPRTEEELRRLGEARAQKLRSAMDYRELDHLWLSACAGDLIELRGTTAVATTERPSTDEEWVQLALLLFIQRLRQLDVEYSLPPVIYTLMNQALPHAPAWNRDELLDNWASAPHNLMRDEPELRSWSDEGMQFAVLLLEDFGVVQTNGDMIEPTPLGHDLALVTAGLIDQGLLGEE
ncbi:MAG: hypothetical protein Q4G67_11680 [Actinomycetia bacterium]|nr:hypothetical protein [Actinomycetes bacterium]